MKIDKYENMRLLFLDFIDTASDEVDEEAWKDKLTTLDELLAEVKRLREGNHEMAITLHDLGYRWDEETGEMYHRDDTRRGD